MSEGNPTYPPIIRNEVRQPDGSVLLDLWVGADLPLLAGHFPGQPILPGIVQLYWAKLLAAARFPIEGKFSRIANLKFHRPIQPDSLVSLHLSYHSDRRHLTFSYRSPVGDHAAGRLEFGS